MTSRPNAVPLRPDYSAARRSNGASSFARSVFARVQARTLNRDVADFIPKDDTLTPLIVQRAAAPIGTTTGSGFAAELARDAWREYLASLSPYSGAARLVQLAVQATAHSFASVFYPVRAAGAQAPGFVGEAEAIPVRGDTFSLVTLGPLRKLASIVGWSKELGKRADAENIFKVMLREDVVAGIDAAFFSDAAADATRPAGLLNGVVATGAATGTDEAAARTDLAALASAVGTDGSGNVTFIVSPDRLARLRILAPTVFPVLDIVASAALSGDYVVAVDARSLIIAIGPDPDISISSVATLHFDTEPLPIVDGATASPVRDLWQTASLAARLIHEISFAKRRAGAVAFVDAANW